MNRMKSVLSVLGATALTVSLAACGGDDDDYCDLAAGYEEAEIAGEAMFTDPDAFDEARDAFQAMAAAAPSEISDDWNRMNEFIDAMADMDMTDEEALMGMLEDFADVEQVMERVEQHLDSECGLS